MLDIVKYSEDRFSHFAAQTGESAIDFKGNFLVLQLLLMLFHAIEFQVLQNLPNFQFSYS